MKESDYYKKLRSLRLAKNLGYKKMAKEVNLSTGYYWQIENKKKNLYYNRALDIAKYFGLKPDDIFYEEE